MILCFAPCFLHPAAVHAARQTVSIPLSIDYPFLQSVFVRQAFTQPGERAVPLDTAGGCSRIELWNPTVGPVESLIQLASNTVGIQAGLPRLQGTCLKMAEWEGAIEVLQQVIFDQAKGRLGVETKGFRPSAPTGSRSALTRILSGPDPTSSVRSLHEQGEPRSGDADQGNSEHPAEFALPGSPGEKAGSRVSTLRVGQVQVKQEGILVDLLMDVWRHRSRRGGPAPGPATPADLAGLTKVWEDGDSFAVSLIESLIGQPVTRAGEGRCPWRRSSMPATGSLRRLKRERPITDSSCVSSRRTGGSSALFSGVYAIEAVVPSIPRVTCPSLPSPILSLHSGASGPGLGSCHPTAKGCSIFRDCCGDRGTEPVLEYTSGVNTGLRPFFGLRRRHRGTPGFLPDVTEMDLTEFFPEDATPAAAGHAEIAPCACPDGKGVSAKRRGGDEAVDPDDRRNGELPRRGEADPRPVVGGGRPQDRHRFRLSAPVSASCPQATAWLGAESCWRQFLGTENEVRPIVSYNQTSVGLMQINERVWRGIYRPDNLRWNTRGTT
ncbi:MAG: hypothetical protein MZV70_00625 [Desulfobacterales bacterium]|nr:hypothetical protein [Desulfobacterales bacterium]